MLTACEQDQDEVSWSSPKAVRKPVWHIPLLCVQWKTPCNEQETCPKHVEFYNKNKFDKLVHLVGFIIRIYHDARSYECQIIIFLGPYWHQHFSQMQYFICMKFASRHFEYLWLGLYSAEEMRQYLLYRRKKLFGRRGCRRKININLDLEGTQQVHYFWMFLYGRGN
jgi:hypothetical protein